MKPLLILLVQGIVGISWVVNAGGTENQTDNDDSSVTLPNILTDDFQSDPVRDMQIDMLHIDLDHARDEKYYLLVLKVDYALNGGFIKRVADSKYKEKKGINVEHYTVVENKDTILLPSVEDLKAAKDFFKRANEESSEDKHTKKGSKSSTHQRSLHRQHSKDLVEEKEDK